MMGATRFDYHGIGILRQIDWQSANPVNVNVNYNIVGKVLAA